MGKAVSVDAQTRDLFRRMPKAELHLHLDGSLRPDTAVDLARARGMGRHLSRDALKARLVAAEHTGSQAELLKAFRWPIKIMQDAEAIELITHELVVDVASDGTRYAEIRWAPALHTMKGLDLPASIQAVVNGVKTGMAATGIHVRLIAVALRSHSPELNLEVAREAAKFISDGVTGFDLAGAEMKYPDPLLHRDAYVVARKAGMGITIHAGEWGGAQQVWKALVVGPSRIAHGAPAFDDPMLVDDLKARNITLDLCPTSNVQASMYANVVDHPLGKLYRAGVPVTLSTDDRTVSNLTLPKEYENAFDHLGLSAKELWAINMHALDVAFLQDDEALRTDLIADFSKFESDEPLLVH